jgi:hypothetical protein
VAVDEGFVNCGCAKSAPVGSYGGTEGIKGTNAKRYVSGGSNPGFNGGLSGGGGLGLKPVSERPDLIGFVGTQHFVGIRLGDHTRLACLTWRPAELIAGLLVSAGSQTIRLFPGHLRRDAEGHARDACALQGSNPKPMRGGQPAFVRPSGETTLCFDRRPDKGLP